MKIAERLAWVIAALLLVLVLTMEFARELYLDSHVHGWSETGTFDAERE